MNRLTKSLVLASLLVLIVVSATDGVAGPPGSAWYRFTNPTVPGALDFNLQVTGQAPILPADIATLGPPATGAAVANQIFDAICAAAVGCGACPALGGVAKKVMTCGPAPNRFTVVTNDVDGTAPDFPNSIHITPVNAMIINSNIQWNNVFAADLLETYTVRLDPNGTNGIATFEVEDANEAVLGSFIVNTTGQTDLQIHNAIRSGYLGLGLGLGAIVCDASTLATESIDPSTFPGYGVRVTYPSNVQGFEVLSVPGQLTTTEMTGAAGVSDVPTMSEWGMAILVALLLITGIWMMRRRQRLQSA